MTFLNEEQRGILQDSPSWIARSNVPFDALVERVSAAAGSFPEAVRDRLRTRLLQNPDLARVDLAAIRLAGEAGSTPVDADDAHYLLQTAEGERFALDTLSWATPTHPRGRPADVARLSEVLDRTFHGRRYALYLRRAVPPGFDAAPVARAVHLWLQAIDRGEWKGRHAIYEDDDVALELTLVSGGDGREGRVMRVGPIDALERLEAVDAVVVDRAGKHRLDHPALPLVLALGAAPRWRLPRGYVQQLLYGTAARTEAAIGPEGPTYRATFRASGRALFADAALANLGSVWWVEGAGEDPLGFDAWCNDNPWAICGGLPDVPVSRFLAAESATEEKVLSWYHRPTRDWRGA